EPCRAAAGFVSHLLAARGAQHPAAHDVHGGCAQPEPGAGWLIVADTLLPGEPSAYERSGTPQVIAPGHTLGSVTDKISSIVLTRKTPRGWYLGFAFAFLLTMVLLVSVTYLLIKGIGIWGNNQPIGWAFEITNFVWWIGIGHAGTLISA